MVIDLLRRVRSVWASNLRTAGEPRSSNGASSFHLVWEVPQVPLVEVSATLEVLMPPSVRRLYFWALQVSFASERRLQGGAHLGLQWHPRHPGSTAVNWGGYHSGSGDRSELDGTTSELVSARRNPNTRDFPWRPGRRYRLHVGPAPDGSAGDGIAAWRGTVTDLETGEPTAVRDLYAPGSYLVSPMVWSEVFARCEHPPVTVRWSDLTAITAEGETARPATVRVNYQARSDGGCDNTSASVDELGLLQATAVARQVPQGAILPVPRA
jgi:hypothetical protein